MGYFSNTVLLRICGILAGVAGLSQAKSAIVGGKSISIKDAPYQMYMRMDEGGGATGLCGAVWIGQRWVLTAAHCVEGAVADRTTLWAGITRTREAKETNALHVARIIANPEFPKTWKDVAVIELSQDVTSPLAKPIPFATVADSKAGLTSPGKLVIATGWGGTNRDGDLADSLQMLRTAVADTEKYVISMVPKGTPADAGSCGGDSGGPFVVRDAAGTGWIVAGLSSFITSYCGDPNSPSSYSRVSALSSWIIQNTGMTVGGIDPRGIIREPFLTASGRFHLDHPQRLELQVIDPAGAVLYTSRGYISAGDHPIPASGRAAGARYLRLLPVGRGEMSALPAFHAVR